MPQVSLTRTVQVPAPLLWTLMVEKVEFPHRFVADVGEVEIIERSDTAVLRRMVVGDQEVTEWIRFDPERREVVFSLVDHPRFDGSVINRLEDPVPPEQHPKLVFSMDWVPVDDGPDLEDAIAEAMLTRAMEQTLKVAQALITNAERDDQEGDGEASEDDD